MLLHAFVSATRANGPGLRAVIYFQGCTLNCSGCWNRRTHKFKGQDLAVRDVAQLFEEARGLERLEGVTFSGGEPMQQAEALLELMDEIHQAAPSVSFGMFTGYTEAELATGTVSDSPEGDTRAAARFVARRFKDCSTSRSWAVTTEHSRRRSRYGRAGIKG